MPLPSPARPPRLDRAPVRARSWHASTLTDRGANATEYGAVIILVAAITVVVLTSGVSNAVVEMIDDAICAIESGESCSDDDTNGEVSSPDPGNQGEALAGDSGHEATPPSPEDFEEVADEVEDIKDFLDDPDAHDSDWYNPFSWYGNTNPNDILSDMSQNELDTLLWSLTEDELRDLLENDEFREHVVGGASLETLRMVREIDPTLLEADTTDVGGDDADDDNTGGPDDITFEEHPDVPLWGEEGEPSIVHVDQGALGDCWWLAGMGSIARLDPDAIMDMIEENDNGTYTVTFQDTGEQVTVTPDVATEDGSPAFSNPQGHFPALWPSIMEKALAEREGSYGEIEGGFITEGMEHVTGDEADYYDSENYEAEDLQEWFEDDVPLAITTTGGEGPLYEDGPHEGGLTDGHAYVVTKVDDGMVQLYNPWGDGQPAPIPIEDLREQTSGLTRAQD